MSVNPRLTKGGGGGGGGDGGTTPLRFFPNFYKNALICDQMVLARPNCNWLWNGHFSEKNLTVGPSPGVGCPVKVEV